SPSASGSCTRRSWGSRPAARSDPKGRASSAGASPPIKSGCPTASQGSPGSSSVDTLFRCWRRDNAGGHAQGDSDSACAGRIPTKEDAMTFVISAAVLAVLSLVLGGAVHAWLLGPEYAKLTTLFRPPQDHQGYFAYMILAHVALAIGFTWIYRQGRERKPFLGQGIRFGLAVAILAVVPMYLIYYAVQPMPGAL